VKAFGKGARPALIAVLLLLLAGACTHDRVLRHRLLTLEPADSLWRLSRIHRVSLDALVRANPSLDPAQLQPGSRIRVPVRQDWIQPVALRPMGNRREADAFVWPVSARISSRFGWRGSRRHTGVDLRAPRGTPVRAAESGRVIWSGRARGYGWMIKIKHSSSFVTAYAHNNVNLVHKGAWVFRGQVIGRVGRSGNATGPHLHFEVIRNGRARDPLYYLPVGRPGLGVARPATRAKRTASAPPRHASGDRQGSG
jgi:murein DD-endopeptidase MepM/ murein hydrolase activator NlpD